MVVNKKNIYKLSIVFIIIIIIMYAIWTVYKAKFEIERERDDTFILKEDDLLDDIDKKYIDSLHINGIPPISRVGRTGLYIGSLESIYFIKKEGITHVINLSTVSYKKYEDVEYLDIFIYDNPEEDISKYFNISNSFIDDAINSGGKVLIHCHAGVSRSSTILIAYLMYSKNLTMEDALMYVRYNRPIVNPNKGFTKQLKNYENTKI